MMHLWETFAEGTYTSVPTSSHPLALLLHEKLDHRLHLAPSMTMASQNCEAQWHRTDSIPARSHLLLCRPHPFRLWDAYIDTQHIYIAWRDPMEHRCHTNARTTSSNSIHICGWWHWSASSSASFIRHRYSLLSGHTLLRVSWRLDVYSFLGIMRPFRPGSYKVTESREEK